MHEKEITLGAKGHNETARCHLMPCRIEHKESTVKAREYFWPTIKELKEGGDEEMGREESTKAKIDISGEINQASPILTASFRGRPLQGMKLKVPAGYRGCLLVDGQCKKEFNNFSYWNWDELPNNDDTVVKALSWINISQAIHE